MSRSPGAITGGAGMRKIVTIGLATLATALVAGQAWAAQITRLSPEGVVPGVRQVAIRFAEPMVPMGDLKAAAPAALSCQGGNTSGQGRWVDASNWVFDFEQDLPPGVRCSVRMTT